MTVASRLKRLQKHLTPAEDQEEQAVVVPLSPSDFRPSDSEDTERLPAQVRAVRVGQQDFTVDADGRVRRGPAVVCLMPDDFGDSPAENCAGEQDSQENATHDGAS